MVDAPRVEDRFAAVRQVSRVLTRAGVAHALGGGALRWALGLATTVRDWDLTTDADEARVRAALEGFDVAALAPTEPYRSAFALRVRLDGEVVEVVGGFAIEATGRVEAVPTRVWGDLDGVPLADPRAWARAYRLLGRAASAAALEAFLAGDPSAGLANR